MRALALVVSLLFLSLAAARPASARCRHLDVPEELAESLYVFEGVLESAGATLTFRVTGVYQGTPPSRVSVVASGRRSFGYASDVGQTFLVFALGTDPSELYVARCGSSGPLGSAGRAVAELAALGHPRRAP